MPEAMAPIEVLHIDDCPNWQTAAERVRTALDAVGAKDVEVVTRLVATREDAAASGFAGSPTIMVGGADLFPSDGATPDLACRVYATGQGLAGCPTLDQLTTALHARLG